MRTNRAERGFSWSLCHWSYLASVGWRGIRIRKRHVEILIGTAAALLRASGSPVRIMDVAAGHGRYVLDAAASAHADSILLRDYSDLNVAAGRAMIHDRGLDDKVEFVIGNAFDAESLAAVVPKPTLVVVSGLYELFADNALIRSSLSGISPGGGSRRLSDIHEPALASTARVDRQDAHQPPPESVLGDATAHAAGDGSVGCGCGFRER